MGGAGESVPITWTLSFSQAYVGPENHTLGLNGIQLSKNFYCLTIWAKITCKEEYNIGKWLEKMLQDLNTKFRMWREAAGQRKVSETFLPPWSSMVNAPFQRNINEHRRVQVYLGR